MDEEGALSNYITYCHQRSFPLSRQMIKAFAREIIMKSGRPTTVNLENGPSDKWFTAFMRRFPHLRMRTPDILDRGRARMANKTVWKQHFDLLEETMKRMGNDILFN
jgi:hypothetical protein